MTLGHAAIIETRRVAILEVKTALWPRKIKAQLLPLKVIRAQADDYLASHPELYSAARERVAAWPIVAKCSATKFG